MVQILNITDVRNKLGNLVESVSKEGKKVVIIRDSLPEAVLIPYNEYLNSEEQKEKEWKIRFEKLLAEGKKYGKFWAKKKGIDIDKLSEEEIYDLVAKA